MASDVTVHVIDATNGKALLVEATDADSGDNGELLFTILDDNMGFLVDDRTGAMKKMGGRGDDLQEYNIKVSSITAKPHGYP